MVGPFAAKSPAATGSLRPSGQRRAVQAGRKTRRFEPTRDISRHGRKHVGDSRRITGSYSAGTTQKETTNEKIRNKRCAQRIHGVDGGLGAGWRHTAC